VKIVAWLAGTCLLLLPIGVPAQEAPPPTTAPAPATTPVQDDPLAAPREALTTALGSAGIEKMAVLHAEATGTTNDLSGLEAALLDGLAKIQGLAVVPPEEVRAKVGVEFNESPEGIAGVAKKVSAKAALYPRVVVTTKGVDLSLLLVDEQGKILLDQVYALPALPPGKNAPPESEGVVIPPARPGEIMEPPEVPSSPTQPEPPAMGSGVPAPDPMEEYARRRLAFAPRERHHGSGAIMVGGPHFAVAVDAGPLVVHEDWMLVEGQEPISEPELAKLAGAKELFERLQGEINAIKTVRNVGIGMTLGGFIVAGVAFPFFKGSSDTSVAVGGTFVGVGLAAGISGLVLWLIYGPRASLAESPYPTEHLIGKPEAEKMIRAYNERLRRELKLKESDFEQPGTPPPPPPPRAPEDSPDNARNSNSSDGPARFGFSVVPNLGGGASATFGFVF
jgi:hypothetical protein